MRKAPITPARLVLVAALVLVGLISTACASDLGLPEPAASSEPVAGGEEELTLAVSPDLVAAHNRLGILVFRHLLTEQALEATTGSSVAADVATAADAAAVADSAAAMDSATSADSAAAMDPAAASDSAAATDSPAAPDPAAATDSAASADSAPATDSPAAPDFAAISGSAAAAGRNVFISPVSIALALNMAWNGAAGETERAMAQALQLARLVHQNGTSGHGADADPNRDNLGPSRAAINAANLALLDALAGTDVRLDIASSIWYRLGITPNPAFLEDNEHYYRASVAALDFGAAESVHVINRWVRDATQGLIPSVLEQLEEDQVLLLINAVYFKGAWSTPFDARLTRDMPFHRMGGESRIVPMMYRNGQFDYFEGVGRSDDVGHFESIGQVGDVAYSENVRYMGDVRYMRDVRYMEDVRYPEDVGYMEGGFQAVRLPYGESKRLAMYVFLPPEGVGLFEFAASLDHETLANVFGRFTPRHGEVFLPRIDISYKANLNDALRALGMGVAFDPGAADFSRMLQGTGPASASEGAAAPGASNVYIGDAIHQSVLKVDEEGTEAAAVTSIDFRLTSVPVYDFRFQADRPFVVVIRDDATGALLFVGAITDPGT